MKTPALLLEDGDSLTESAAILQHIARRGGTLEHDRLNEMLAYLTTDYFSAYAPLWKLYDAADLDAGYPHLAAWFRRMELDPTVQFALAIERGEEPAGNGAFRSHVQMDGLHERLVA